MDPDDWFGEIGLLERTARTATVTATAPAELWQIPGEVFLAALSEVAVLPDPLRLSVIARLGRTHPNRGVRVH